ncbi:prepilin-type N-terminal cleavage/methylation domain-containing protein [Aeoliella sp.]|uniref:prepilin-type N-terminal cleavage/methylation domain-containing protein n=1 Tax=Aeoliella sp. TaxID=2795800 RepID=UPI003CCBBFB6
MRNLRRRRAFSLVELMVVVFCTSVIAAAAIALLHHLGAWGRSVQDSATQAAAADRMEQALRRELQQATDLQATGATLAIATYHGTSQWQLAKDACQVKWTAGDDSPRHERFDIGPHSDWQVATEEGLAIVVLDIEAGERGMPLRVVEPLREREGASDE